MPTESRARALKRAAVAEAAGDAPEADTDRDEQHRFVAGRDGGQSAERRAADRAFAVALDARITDSNVIERLAELMYSTNAATALATIEFIFKVKHPGMVRQVSEHLNLNLNAQFSPASLLAARRAHELLAAPVVEHEGRPPGDGS